MFTNNLEVYRIQPLCGPNEGGTPVHLIGTGFHASEDVKVKWGVVATDIMPRESIQQMVDARLYSDELQIMRSSESIMPVKQKPINPSGKYNTAIMKAP